MSLASLPPSHSNKQSREVFAYLLGPLYANEYSDIKRSPFARGFLSELLADLAYKLSVKY